MTSGRYPLERIAALRADTADERVRDLAAALAAETEAEAALATRTATVTRLEGARRDAARLDGPAPAWALARQAAWAIRLERDLTAARARRDAAQRDLAARRAEADAARAAAAQARAERTAVERHREDWDDRERKRRERAED